MLLPQSLLPFPPSAALTGVCSAWAAVAVLARAGSCEGSATAAAWQWLTGTGADASGPVQAPPCESVQQTLVGKLSPPAQAPGGALERLGGGTTSHGISHSVWYVPPSNL